MAFREKRIDLMGLDAKWDANCFIQVGVKGFKEIKTTQREIRNNQNKLELADLKIAKIKRKIDKADDEEFDNLLLDLEKLEKESGSFTDKIMDLMIGVIKDGFKKGMMYDYDKKENREMTIDDVDNFDVETVRKVCNYVLGTNSKNV